MEGRGSGLLIVVVSPPALRRLRDVVWRGRPAGLFRAPRLAGRDTERNRGDTTVSLKRKTLSRVLVSVSAHTSQHEGKNGDWDGGGVVSSSSWPGRWRSAARATALHGQALRGISFRKGGQRGLRSRVVRNISLPFLAYICIILPCCITRIEL